MLKNRKFILKNLFLFVFIVYLIGILFAAQKYKINSCNPNQLEQGIQDIVLNISTNEPMPQNSLNEYLYSEIQFSNPGIHIKDVKFLNAYNINCTISTDKYIDILKPIDMSIISYNDKGEEVVFEGKKILQLVRKSYIEDLVVHTSDGKVSAGDSVNITLKGYNFQEGKIGILVMWSGLPIINTTCNNSRQLRFSLSGEETKKLKTGEYAVYIYNKDGSGAQSTKKIIVK